MKTNLRLIGGQRLVCPNNIYTRPTTLRVREAIFNILKNKVENSNWLDLFSGTGAISCEAYNHGAKKIVAIEKNKNISRLCVKNLLSLHNIEYRKNDIDVLCKDVLTWTRPENERNISSNIIDFDKIKFDFIYLDPPYDANYHNLVLNQIFNCDFVKKGTMIICEHSPNLNIQNESWDLIDVRTYGQSRLSFLIYV